MNDISTNEPTSISIWMEDRGVCSSYYGVPNSVILSEGDTIISNCLSGEAQQVNKTQLQQYNISPETASEYLINSIMNNTASIKAVIKNQVTEISNNINIEKIKSLDLALEKADWTKIIEECLELEPEEVENNPKLFKVGLQEFLIELINSINDRAIQDRVILRRIENILASHGFEVGDSLEQLVGLIQGFVEDDSVSSTDKTEFRQQLKSLSQINVDDLELETLMETVIDKMDEVETLSINTEVEYQENIDKAMRDIVEEYPLPNFDFDDLKVIIN